MFDNLEECIIVIKNESIAFSNELYKKIEERLGVI